MMYIRTRGKVSGPHDEEMLRSMVQRGQITLLDEASEDRTEWEPADSFAWFQPESRVVSSGETDETDEGAGETDELDLESHLVEESESEEDELQVDIDAFDTPQDAAAPAAPLQLDDPQQPEEEPVTGMDGFSLSSLASGTASPASSFNDDLVIEEEPKQVSSGDSNFQSYSQPPQVAREEYELIDRGEEEVGAGSSSRKGSSSLIVLGYIAGFLSLFVLPALLGLVGVVCGMINFSQEEHVHGAAQIAIAIVCTILGLVVIA